MKETAKKTFKWVSDGKGYVRCSELGAAILTPPGSGWDRDIWRVWAGDGKFHWASSLAEAKSFAVSNPPKQRVITPAGVALSKIRRQKAAATN